MKNDARFLARPSRAQYLWQDHELGMFFHWLPYQQVSFDSSRMQDPAYQLEIAGKITAENFHAEQYVQSALELGAGYIVFVAKHETGFCRWRSAYGNFQIGNSGYPGDPIAELYEECTKHGIRMGVYICGNDNPHGAGGRGITHDPAKQDSYNRLYRSWLTELLSKYGDMCEVWFDGSIAIDVGDILKKYAPNAVVFQSRWASIRWVGQEEGVVSYPAWNAESRYDAVSGLSTQLNGDPDGDAWMPLECDARLRKEWGFCFDLEQNPLKTVDELMEMYYRSVGHGANLLINHAPHPLGHILDEDMARMKEFGDEIRRRFGKSLAETTGEGETVVLDLNGKQPVDHVILMEDTLFGERVRLYVVEGYTGEAWIQLCAGSAIGHKKIDFFRAQEVEKIRIRVLENVGTPLIRRLAAFYVGEIPAFGVAEYGEDMVGELTYAYDYSGEAESVHTYTLTPYIHDAGQYRIEIRRTTGNMTLHAIWTEFEGIRQEGYITDTEEENVFLLTVNGPSNIVLKLNCTLNHPYSGNILIRRVN